MKTFTVELTGHITVETDQQCDAEVLTDRILDEIRAVFAGHGAVTESSIAVAAIREQQK